MVSQHAPHPTNCLGRLDRRLRAPERSLKAAGRGGRRRIRRRKTFGAGHSGKVHGREVTCAAGASRRRRQSQKVKDDRRQHQRSRLARESSGWSLRTTIPGPIGRLSRVGASTRAGVMAVATSVPQSTIAGSGIPRDWRQTCQTAEPRPAPASRIWSSVRAHRRAAPAAQQGGQPSGQERQASAQEEHQVQGTRKGRTPGRCVPSTARCGPLEIGREESRAKHGGPAQGQNPPPATSGGTSTARKARGCASLEPGHQPDRRRPPGQQVKQRHHAQAQQRGMCQQPRCGVSRQPASKSTIPSLASA